MKTHKPILALLLAALCAVQQARSDAPGGRLSLMVDEDGRLNSTNTVATVADLSAAAAGALVADAKAEAAKDAADAGTNMIAGVSAAIASSELVVYVKGRVSSFEAGVLFGPDDEIGIYDFKVPANAGGTPTVKPWGFPTAPLGTQTVGSNTYQNAYLMTKTFASLPRSFFRVGLEPDAPSGDGALMDIKGVTGGFTGRIAAGETLVVSNGVVVGKEAQ